MVGDHRPDGPGHGRVDRGGLGDGLTSRPAVDRALLPGAGGERHLPAHGPLGHVLGALEEAAVVVAVQIDALVPGHLAERAHQPDPEQRVPLVPPGLQPLTEPVVVQDGNGVLNRPEPFSMLEIVNGAGDLGPVVAEEAGGQDAGHGGEVPVGPVVGDDGAVVPDQEVVAERAEDGAEHLLEPGEVEVRVVADEFGGVGELIAVQPGGEEPVGAARESGQLPGPGVEDLDGGVEMDVVTADVSAQGVLVGGVDVVVEDRVVLRRAGAAVDGGLGVGGPGALGVPVGGEPGESGGLGRGALADLLGHAAQVGAGVQERV